MVRQRTADSKEYFCIAAAFWSDGKMRIVRTPKAPQPIGPYSQGIVAGNFVFTAGMIGLDPRTDKIAGPSIKDQTSQALENVRAVLEQAGSSIGRIVKTTVYLKDQGLFRQMNEAYSAFFGEHKPARSTIICGFMGENILVEIEAVAEA